MSRFAKILRIRKTQLALAIVFGAGLFLLPMYGAHAQVTGVITGIAATAFNSILFIIVQILGRILAFIAQFADSVMQPVAITSSAVVIQAWGVTRDFANMFFILILLGIALDFILFNSFQVKRMIPRLILVALLINFSLPIAGVLIDFANVFTTFFLSQVSDPQVGFTGTIANQLSISHLLDSFKDEASVGAAFTAQNNLFLNLVFTILFLFGTAFVFLVLALMFLVRTGYLYVLLVMLPLVLVLSAFPPTAGRFGQWTSKFVQWTMFAPIATFFLYFAVLMFNELIAKNLSANQNLIGDGLYKYIIVWIFLLGALTAAQGMGGKAASMAMGAAGWAKGKTIQGLKRGGTAGLTAAGRSVGADAQMEKLASGLQKIPGFGMVASGVRGIASKTKTAMNKQEALTQAEEAKYKGLSNEALRKELEVMEKSKLPGSDIKAVRINEILTKRGGHIERDAEGVPQTAIINERAERMYAIAKKHGDLDAMKTIRKANPVAYQKIAEDEWKQEKENIVDVKDKDGKVIGARNKITGKTLKETQNRAFEEMTSADFENLKGMWTEPAVKDFVKSGVMSQGHLRMANTNADQRFMDYVGNALEDKEVVKELKDKSKNFYNYLKSGGAYEYYGLKISDGILASMGEEVGGQKKDGKKEGGEKPEGRFTV